MNRSHSCLLATPTDVIVTGDLRSEVFEVEGLLLTFDQPSKYAISSQCWADVVDDGPASTQHWFNGSCLLGNQLLVHPSPLDCSYQNMEDGSYINPCPAGPGYMRFQASLHPNKMPLKMIKYSVVDAQLIKYFNLTDVYFS